MEQIKIELTELITDVVASAQKTKSAEQDQRLVSVTVSSIERIYGR